MFGPPLECDSSSSVIGKDWLFLCNYACFVFPEKEKLSKEQLEELLGSVDFTRLSSAALNRALEKEVVPAIKIARGALALCSRLEQDVSRLKAESREKEEQILLLQKPSPVNLSLSPDETTPPRAKSPSASRKDLGLEEATLKGERNLTVKRPRHNVSRLLSKSLLRIYTQHTCCMLLLSPIRLYSFSSYLALWRSYGLKRYFTHSNQM